MAALTEPMNLGDVLKYEAPNLYSRERITVASGQNLLLGTVVGLVTASGHYKQVDPSADDGSQVAVAVLLQDCDASRAERQDGLAVARHAIVAEHALIWPEAMTLTERALAMAQLKALGVLVRQGA